MSSSFDPRASPARLPSLANFKEFYRERARFFGQSVKASWATLVEKNAVRIVVALVVGAAVAAGFFTADWKAIAWPALLVLASFAISVVWLWFASGCAVATGLRRECENLRGLTARRKVDQTVAATLKARFEAGLGLMKDVAAPEFLKAYEEWKATVLADLNGVSQEDEFVFGSAGFEHEIVMFQQGGPPETIHASSQLAMTVKLGTLREIVGKSFKLADGGLVGLAS